MNMEEKEIKKDLPITDATINAVQVIKAAILQSQQRALKAINQEQLALYYGIGRYVSTNTRKKNWRIIIRQSKLTNIQKLTQDCQFRLTKCQPIRQFKLSNYKQRAKFASCN
jgi:hypothetical protein